MSGAQYEDLPRPQGGDADSIIGPFWPEVTISELLDAFRSVDNETSSFEARAEARAPRLESSDEDRANHLERLTRFVQLAPHSSSVALGATRTHQLTLTAAVERFRTARQLAFLVGEPFDDEAERARARSQCLQSCLMFGEVLAKVNSVTALKPPETGGE